MPNNYLDATYAPVERTAYATIRFPKGVASPSAIPPGADVAQEMPNRSVLNLEQIYDADPPTLLRKAWTYTIPVKRRALVQSAAVRMTRLTAGAPSGSTAAYIRIKRYGYTYPPALPERIVDIYVAQLPVGVSEKSENFGGLHLFEGDTIEAQTEDNGAAGGTMNWGLWSTIIEFDSTLPSPNLAALAAQQAMANGSGASSPATANLQPYVWGPGNLLITPDNPNYFTLQSKQVW